MRGASLPPDERRRLVSVLLSVLVFLCLVAFFCFLVVPGLRFQDRTYPVGPVRSGPGDTGWLDPTDVPATAGMTLPPVDPSSVMDPHPALVARGRVLYAQRCASCHGPDGKGDGPAARGLAPSPRDFTRKEGWTNGPGLPAIYTTLEEGVPGTSMASFATLGRRDRMALAHVVRAFGAFALPADPVATEALRKLFSSTGETLPPRIPVRRAARLLILEFSPAQPLPVGLGNPSTREGIQDPERAAETLAGIPHWKSSQAAFVKGVEASIPGNGFSPSVLTYSPRRWRALHRALGGTP